MGSRGPIPDPGSARSKDGRNSRHRPKASPRPSSVKPPPWVASMPAALDFWQRIAPRLIADGRLLPEQADSLGQLARLHADILQLQDQVAAEGWISATDKGQSASPVTKILRDSRRDFVSLAREFGLTAAAAARIPQDPPADGKEDSDEEDKVLRKLSILRA
ncbi:MAG: P27 family phage terminase small subunit [Planctomycetia bacterium]|nr:P27 family phage terminase small subunit [Planctomycetia bacterium]